MCVVWLESVTRQICLSAFQLLFHQCPILICYQRSVLYFTFVFPCIITLYYIKSQRDAALAVLFINHCKITTCFGCFLRPSSGVLKTVIAATGACHESG